MQQIIPENVLQPTSIIYNNKLKNHMIVLIIDSNLASFGVSGFTNTKFLFFY